jgi:uncharacterized surface protein with fasciclin (FAS1) repeats
MNKSTQWLLALGTSFLVAACGGGNHNRTPAAPQGNLVQVAQAGGFTSLVAAATKAGLASALSDANARLTVFAPTDAAFTQLATRLGFASTAAMVEALPAPVLAQILTYHVLPTEKTAADLTAGGASQATLYKFGAAQSTLALNTTSGVVITDAVLTTAKVVTPNVEASNGVVHAIDKVLVPPGVLNVVQMAQLNPLFDKLVGAVVAANLQGTLSGTGPFTVFAPTNDAFTAIDATVKTLTVPQLTTVLTYHVLNGQVLAANIPFATAIPTLATQTIRINAGPPITITDTTTTASPIVATDVRASNGVIHVIGKVLIPTL